MWSSPGLFLLSFFFEFYEMDKKLVFASFLYLIEIPCFVSDTMWNVSTVGNSKPCLFAVQVALPQGENIVLGTWQTILWALPQSHSG